jgi:hypothetical protein
VPGGGHNPDDITNPTAGTLSLIPYVEPPRTILTQQTYPNNIQGETFLAGMLNTVTYLALASGYPSYALSGSDCGQGGAGMAIIQKGGSGDAYAVSLYEVRAIKALAQAQSKTYVVGATVLTHGEADWNDTSYATQVHTLQQNYQTDIQAITGQSRAIPMLATQQSTTPVTNGAVPNSTYYPISALQLLAANNANPTQVVLVGQLMRAPMCLAMLLVGCSAPSAPVPTASSVSTLDAAVAVDTPTARPEAQDAGLMDVSVDDCVEVTGVQPFAASCAGCTGRVIECVYGHPVGYGTCAASCESEAGVREVGFWCCD